MRATLFPLILGVGVAALLAQNALTQNVPQPGPPNGVACAYNTTPPTLTDGQAGWVQCDATGHIATATSSSSSSTTVVSTQASAVARGGAVTAGGTAQTLAAANAARKGIIIQNPCSATEQGIATAENLYINLTSAATVSTSANIAVLPPCSSFAMGVNAGLVSTELVSVIATTTAHIWYAKEF